jgi:RNA polymerase sigma factor (TIGR02999 family)
VTWPWLESTSGRDPDDITRLLNDSDSSSPADKERLAELVYGELRRIAGSIMASERPGNSLQATALATDAYLSLVQNHNVEWCDRFHFFNVAARAMRRVLVDHSRRKASQKRGAGWERTDTESAATFPMRNAEELLTLDQALDRLEQLDGRQSQIVELRYFGGLTEEEVAELLDISLRTVKREWSVARAWLYAELTRVPDSRPGPDGSWPV